MHFLAEVSLNTAGCFLPEWWYMLLQL
jgi:hypothetical protein